MRYRKLDLLGDYTFGHGQDDYYTGQIAVGQAIKTRLLLLLGEWWEDLGDGLPLFQNILGQRGSSENMPGIDLIIQSRIVETPDVVAIKAYQSDFDNVERTLGVYCVVETPYGDAEVEVRL